VPSASGQDAHIVSPACAPGSETDSSALPNRVQSVQLSTCNIDQLATAAGLRKWPMHVEQSLGLDGGGPFKRIGSGQDAEEGEEASTRRRNKDDVMDEVSEAGKSGGERGVRMLATSEARQHAQQLVSHRPALCLHGPLCWC
jgi:hypothetical protein